MMPALREQLRSPLAAPPPRQLPRAQGLRGFALAVIAQPSHVARDGLQDFAEQLVRYCVGHEFPMFCIMAQNQFQRDLAAGSMTGAMSRCLLPTP